MKDLKKFNIQFVGLKEGSHLFEYEIDNTFFEAFNYDEFLSSSIKVTLDFIKKSTFFELTFTANGSVKFLAIHLPTLYDQKIESVFPLVVNLDQNLMMIMKIF